MKKHQLEKIIKQLGKVAPNSVINATVKLDEDEGTYYVSLQNHDIVALAMREVDKNGKESFKDKWAVYPVNDGCRDSIYIELYDSVTEAILKTWDLNA